LSCRFWGFFSVSASFYMIIYLFIAPLSIQKLLLETDALAPIGAEILLLFSLKSKRLEPIAGNGS